jgi:hypothetical protein
MMELQKRAFILEFGKVTNSGGLGKKTFPINNF